MSIGRSSSSWMEEEGVGGSSDCAFCCNAFILPFGIGFLVFSGCDCCCDGGENSASWFCRKILPTNTGKVSSSSKFVLLSHLVSTHSHPGRSFANPIEIAYNPGGVVSFGSYSTFLNLCQSSTIEKEEEEEVVRAEQNCKA